MSDTYPAYREEMTPYEYEHFCKDILISRGFDARVTQQSGDQGVDIVVFYNNSPKVVLQCKKYSSPVGNKAIQEIFSAKGHLQAEKAIVVTNNLYTKSAKELANTTGVMLIHHEDLKEIKL